MKVIFFIVLALAMTVRAQSGRRVLQSVMPPGFTGTIQELDALVEWILQGGFKEVKYKLPPTVRRVVVMEAVPLRSQ